MKKEKIPKTSTKINSQIRLEIINEIMATTNFIKACKYAAVKDDGIIDKEEKKIIAKITKLAEKFESNLRELL